MSGPYGRLNRDLFGSSLHIKAKLIIDDSFNLTVANCNVNNIDVSGNVVTKNISEANGMQGIDIVGNLNVGQDYTIKSNNISPSLGSSNVQGVTLLNTIDVKRLGFGKAYLSSPYTFDVNNSNATQIIFQSKLFESNFTTSTSLIHPSNNTSITFKAPSNNSIGTNQQFGNVIIDTKVMLLANIVSGTNLDYIDLSLLRNSTQPLSSYTYRVKQAGITESISFNDLVKINANDTLDLYGFAGNVSGTLVCKIDSSTIKSVISFNIISLED